jgi:hypothetical protein
LTDFKIILISDFLIIHPVGAKLFHADGWTEGQIDRHDKALVAFHNFVNMPKNASFLILHKLNIFLAKIKLQNRS